MRSTTATPPALNLHRQRMDTSMRKSFLLHQRWCHLQRRCCSRNDRHRLEYSAPLSRFLTEAYIGEPGTVNSKEQTNKESTRVLCQGETRKTAQKRAYILKYGDNEFKIDSKFYEKYFNCSSHPTPPHPIEFSSELSA